MHNEYQANGALHARSPVGNRRFMTAAEATAESERYARKAVRLAQTAVRCGEEGDRHAATCALSDARWCAGQSERLAGYAAVQNSFEGVAW